MDITAVCPHVLYQPVGYASIPTLTTTDGGQTFTFGTDANGYAIAPFGKAAIYRSLNDIPDWPMVLNVDYIPLGSTAIQIKDNQSYTGTLYWRGVIQPGSINDDGLHEPALFPEGSRMLIAYKAAINFLLEGGRNPVLAATYMQMYGRPYGGNPGLFAQWLQNWRTQFQNGGALQSASGLQVATGSSTNYNAGF